MTRLAADWLRAPALASVLAALEDGGHRAWLVGGCVRNTILGLSPGDVDIATDARPERVMEVMKAAGLRTVPTGIEHGTVTVVARGEGFEVTTLRRDVKTDGRRAVVAFTEDISEDAARRDFTMNALYARPDGTVLDPLGSGLADLAARLVRFVGDPRARIREDYLRILRFFRFHAWYGEPARGLDSAGLAAVRALAAGVVTLSRERVGHEMRRLLAAPDPAASVGAMAAAGVLGHVLPGAGEMVLARLITLEGKADAPPEPMRRLAALGGNEAAERLRLSRAEARRLATLERAADGHDGPGALGYRLGAGAGRDALLVRAARRGAALPEGWQDALAAGAAAEFPVTARDLMPDHQGAALGRRLRELEARWIASGFRLGRDELLADRRGGGDALG